MKIPYLGEWWRGRDPFQLWTIGEIMKCSPILIMSWGYTFFSQFYGWSVKDSLVIPGLVSIIAEGLYLSWDYGNKSAAARTLPMNMQIKWSQTNIRSYLVTIVDYKVLKEEDKDYQYELIIEDHITDPTNNEKFRHLLVFSKYPFETAFRRIPGQPIIYGGSVFYGPTAVISVLWVGDTENVDPLSDDEPLAAYRVFKVQLCPEDGGDVQEELGISPTIDGDKVKEIKGLSDARISVKLQLDLNKTQLLNADFTENTRSIQDDISGQKGQFMERDRFIREPRFRIDFKNRRIRIVLIILGVAALYGLYRLAQIKGWI